MWDISKDVRYVEQAIRTDMWNDNQRLTSFGDKIETIDASGKDKVGTLAAQGIEVRE